MQLSKLEVKGFKSFGDKITIHFDGGITGIVGPNGCGKSNVVDALRWVLGEQKTKALRSEKMEDVIFNGTKDRKPHHLAEVSVTFNNTKNLLPTEFSQVTITRRYYRTGESEYELNGVGCRLKDINDLFLDTGVGPDSYAIIELKMVENLLNDKDGSRREMFEEAAGISKFKIRKKQSLRKLEETDKDLSRVEDLLFEIEKNLKTLEKQAKQAEKFFEIKETYKKLSIVLARLSIQNKSESLIQLQESAQLENEKRAQLSAQLAKLEAGLDQIKTELIQKENLVKSRQKTLNEHVHKIRQYESEKKIKNERLRFLTDSSVKLSDQILLDKQSNERSEHSIRSLTEEGKVLSKQLAEVELRVEQLKSVYESQKLKANEIQTQVNELTAQQRSRQELVFQLNKSIEINSVQMSSLRQELEKNAHETNNQSAELEGFEDKLRQLEITVQRNEEIWQKLKSEEENRIKQLNDLEFEISQLKEETAQNSRKLDAKTNEFNLTKSLVDNLEGFPDAVRFLKKNSNWVKEAPLLSDILTSDERYRVALENYLEPFMNYFVVETQEQAIQAVNLLSDASKGKANFFILAHFLGFKTKSPKKIEGTVPACTLVEYDQKYHNLLHFLLDEVYIVTENPEQIPNTTEGIFVAETGKMIQKPYSISGGSVGLFEGKRIGRAKNLEILEKEIKKLGETVHKLKESTAQKTEQVSNLKSASKTKELEILTTETQYMKQELVAYQTRKEQISQMLSKNSGRQEEILDQLERLKTENELNAPKQLAEKEALEGIESRLQEIADGAEAEAKRLNEYSGAYNQENIVFYQLKNKFASIEQELGFKHSSFEATKLSIEKNTEELKKVEEDIRLLLDSPDMNDDELTGMYKEKEAIELGVVEAEKTYYGARGEIDSQEKEAKEIVKQREHIDLILQEINTQLHDSKLKLASVKERISIEFNIDLDHAEAEDLPGFEIKDENTLKEEVEQLKSKMDKMGPINPMAMEAYQEIETRYKLITEQRNDILNAKNTLLATIQEIDVTAKANFMEAFENIKENFKKVFRSLFTEDDSCDLSLADPSNPLDSAIDIIAKPKGKRPQSINQLSGGEKTLTAISLLFAIYLLKPAPFCVFDEVDAPLDDANIDKFNNIIRKFADASQFIIVTHNKRTMASTDIMYGVTMIETGISRVVPVDLRELA